MKAAGAKMITTIRRKVVVWFPPKKSNLHPNLANARTRPSTLPTFLLTPMLRKFNLYFPSVVLLQKRLIGANPASSSTPTTKETLKGML